MTTDSMRSRVAYLITASGRSLGELWRLMGGRGYPAHISLFLRGTTNRQGLRSSTIERLADFFGVSADWLLRGRGRCPSERSVRRRVDDRAACAAPAAA